MEKNMEQTDRQKAITWWEDEISHAEMIAMLNKYNIATPVMDVDILRAWAKEHPSLATLEGEHFTKGEWTIKWDNTLKIGTPGNLVASLFHMGNLAETEANAHLIAASKDLYYAIKPFKLLAQEVLDVKNQPQIIYEFNGAKITTEDLSNVLKAMIKAYPNL